MRHVFNISVPSLPSCVYMCVTAFSFFPNSLLTYLTYYYFFTLSSPSFFLSFFFLPFFNFSFFFLLFFLYLPKLLYSPQYKMLPRSCLLTCTARPPHWTIILFIIIYYEINRFTHFTTKVTMSKIVGWGRGVIALHTSTLNNFIF